LLICPFYICTKTLPLPVYVRLRTITLLLPAVMLEILSMTVQLTGLKYDLGACPG
jgi:hypothetical protein